MRTRDWTRSMVAGEFSGCLNLSSLIRAIEKKCADAGEVVCEIRVNGVVLDEDDESKFAATEISRIENLSVKVSDVSNLIDDALGSLVSYLPEMVRLSLLTAEKFRADEIESAHRSLESITQGSRWLVEMFAQLRRNRVVQVKNLEESRWARSEGELLKVTRELVKAFETKDYVLLADVLEYDWVTALQTWQSLLESADTPKAPPANMDVNDGRNRKTASDTLD
ncbi:MAG: hypothetical protein ABL958_03960 [Bdellovibrionia bacterium]